MDGAASTPTESEVSIKETEKSSRRSQIVSFFAQKSGLTPADIEERLGEKILSQFILPVNEVLPTYFGVDENSRSFQRIKHNIDNYRKYFPDQADALAWRDIISFSLIKAGEDIKPEDEKVLEVVASNALVFIQDQLKNYENSNWDLQDYLSPASLERIKSTLKPDETLESRISITQQKLDQARQIGLRIIGEGKIPVMRILFLDKQKRDALIDLYRTRDEFLPKHPDSSLTGYTLKQLAEHTQINAENSPLDSWTYAAPNNNWFYVHEGLLKGNAVILISEVSKDQMLWGRDLSAPFVTSEVWRFYKDFKLDAQPIMNPEKQELTTLDSQGFRGFFSPTELEAVLWGSQPKRGLIDLGTNGVSTPVK